MKSPRHWIPLALLVIAIVVQGWLVTNDYAIQWLKAAWRTRTLTAEERGARFLLGVGGGKYMQFLKDVVPTDRAVVIPFRAGNFSEQNILQFFLIPRGIPSCGCTGEVLSEMTAECVACLRAPSHYVPAIGGFPSIDVLSDDKQFTEFPEDYAYYRGVYGPPLSEPFSNETKSEPKSPVPIPTSFLISAAICLSILVLGSVCISTIDRSPRPVLFVVFGFPLGLGLISFPTFVVSWIGVPITGLTFVVVFLLMLSGLLFIQHRRWGKVRGYGETFRQIWLNLHSLTLGQSLALIGAVAVFAAATTISITRGYSTFDGIANWALKGYGIAQEGSVFAGRIWGGHSLEYPQNLHLSIAVFRLLDGDSLPGSKLIFPILMLCTVAGCYAAWRRIGIDWPLAFAGAIAIATVPILFFHSTLGFANIPFTTYIVTGSLWLSLGLVQSRQTDLILAGLAYAFAVWTRPEGIGFAFLLLASIWLAARLLRVRRAGMASVIAPIAIVSAVWLGFSAKYVKRGEIGEVLAGFASGVLDGSVNSDLFAELFNFSVNNISEPNRWGLAVYALPALLAVWAWRSHRKGPIDHSIWLVLMAGSVAFLVPLGMFLAALTIKLNSTVFLDVSFDRAMFSALILFFWSAVALAANPQRSSEDQGITRVTHPAKFSG